MIEKIKLTDRIGDVFWKLKWNPVIKNIQKYDQRAEQYANNCNNVLSNLIEKASIEVKKEGEIDPILSDLINNLEMPLKQAMAYLCGLTLNEKTPHRIHNFASEVYHFYTDQIYDFYLTKLSEVSKNATKTRNN
ncbi:hypothetical protein K9L16_01860 [Candidatus Pacearchaeota archaeon]|nr:hypothetical protein [Candidatus Pacearchaeota archaeon]